MSTGAFFIDSRLNWNVFLHSAFAISVIRSVTTCLESLEMDPLWKVYQVNVILLTMLTIFLPSGLFPLQHLFFKPLFLSTFETRPWSKLGLLQSKCVYLIFKFLFCILWIHSLIMFNKLYLTIMDLTFFISVVIIWFHEATWKKTIGICLHSICIVQGKQEPNRNYFLN